ncbi:MAG: hypothetical protein Fur0022_25940 [Anaerolineales bacterium]
MSPLHQAIATRNYTRVMLLIESQTNLNVPDAEGFTPLHYAVRIPRLEILMALISAGADVNAATPAGFTPLHGAAEQGSLSKTRYLMEQGADPRARLTHDFHSYPAGSTPQDVAAACGHVNVVRWIEKLTALL